MDKLQKFDYMQSIEQYLDENQIYELFEDLLKQLLVARPEKPLEFLVQQIKSPQSKFSVLTKSPSSPPHFLHGRPRQQQAGEWHGYRGLLPVEVHFNRRSPPQRGLGQDSKRRQNPRVLE